MSEDRRQILEMLSQGKITAAEAENLLKALEGTALAASGGGAESGVPGRKPKYLRVVVESSEGSSKPVNVNVRVPIQLLRAGVKLAGLIPAPARDKVNEALSENGVQFDLKNLKVDDLEELIEQMNELTVDVNDGNERVRVFCE